MRPLGRARLARLGGRLAALAGGALVGLILLELTLRTTAALAPWVLARSGPLGTGDTRILCVGDSHTYGAMVAPADSYPARLHRHLDEAGMPASVVNLGIPGQSSRQVLAHLGAALELHRPEVVLIWAGINEWRPILLQPSSCAS